MSEPACQAPAGFLAPWRALLPRTEKAVRDDLERFCVLLNKWQGVQNLVSRETLDAFWTRHVADSLQILPRLTVADTIVIDLGSGGGFPALPLAIALKDSGRQFHLIEATARKGAFLRTVSRELGLAASVHTCRIEALDSRETGQADVVLARALAPLPQLCALAYPLLAAEGRALFHKGREHVEELAEAGAVWDFDVIIHKSETDRDGAVLELRHLRPKSG